MRPEFDNYAAEYSDLLADPVRDRFATDPIFFHGRKWDLIRKFLSDTGFDPSRRRWLDVGCGRGDLLNLGRGYFSEAVGCDPSAEMIGTASADVFHQPSPTELPFASGSVDFVTAVCVYHHVHGVDRRLLTESIYRVLKPGGIFCIIEHNPWNPITQIIVRRCPVDVDAELLSSGTAAKLAQSAAFNILGADFFLFLPESAYRRFGRMETAFRRVPLGGQFALFSRK